MVAADFESGDDGFDHRAADAFALKAGFDDEGADFELSLIHIFFCEQLLTISIV